LLQTAAVIGTEVPLPLLQAIAEAPQDVLRRSLAHLQAAEFLYETHLYPEQEYTCKHALTHEVAYGSLLQERRRALHAQIVAALARGLDDRPRLVRVLAGMTLGLRTTRAIDSALAAGEEALELAAALGDSALQVQAPLDLGPVYYVLGDYRRAAELFRRNVEAADREADRPRTALQIESQAFLASTLSHLGA